FGERHQHAGSAIAALQAVLVPEGALQCIELTLGSEALDGAHILAVCLDGEHQAGACAMAVDKDGAGAADAVLAAEMRAREAELVAQEIGEREARLDRALVRRAVD